MPVEGEGSVATAIVGTDALHADPQTSIVRSRLSQESAGGFLALIGSELGKRYPGGVVYAHMHAFPADAPDFVPISGNAVAGGREAAELTNLRCSNSPRLARS
jgi:hypothetical protein